jgi:precorrin-2/cobalt-factor-2 C20-methyltransferase
MAYGTLYAIGVGPGDPELITLKGLRRLQSASVILVPQKDSSTESQAYRIAKTYINPERQKILFLPLPMTKDLKRLNSAWEEILKKVIPVLEAGQDMVYILVGDPFFYGTFIYLFKLLKSRSPSIPIEVIPGISSIQAASAWVQWPLAVAEERVAILPATYEEGEFGDYSGRAGPISPFLRQTLEQFDTVVLMKIHRVFDKVLNLLEELGLVENTIYVEKVGFPEERMVRDLRTLRGRELPYLSLLIIKK